MALGKISTLVTAIAIAATPAPAAEQLHECVTTGNNAISYQAISEKGSWKLAAKVQLINAARNACRITYKTSTQSSAESKYAPLRTMLLPFNTLFTVTSVQTANGEIIPLLQVVCAKNKAGNVALGYIKRDGLENCPAE